MADENDWHTHHTPKNLAMAVSIEAAELLEHFTWLEDGKNLNNSEKQKVGEEIADVAMYLVVLCDKLGLDLPDIIDKKLALNASKHC